MLVRRTANDAVRSLIRKMMINKITSYTLLLNKFLKMSNRLKLSSSKQIENSSGSLYVKNPRKTYQTIYGIFFRIVM